MSDQSREEFFEDRSRKRTWFLETRGSSFDQLTEQRDLALECVEALEENRFVRNDPGGDAPDGVVELTSRGGKRVPRSVKATMAARASRPDSEGCVTDVIELVGLGAAADVVIKVSARRGGTRGVDLATVMMFLWDETVSRWTLVDQSGYNTAAGFAWAQVHRDGRYAAVGLPREAGKGRQLVMERFVQFATEYGIDHGLVAERSDVLEGRHYRRIDQSLRAEFTGKADIARLLELKALRTDAVRTRDALRPGSRPEWQIIDFLSYAEEKLLVRSSIYDYLDIWRRFLQLPDKVARWYPLGPNNINGRIKSLAIHPTNGNILYAGAANGGVWKSTDAGDTWRALFTFENSMAIGAIAVAPSNPQVVYAATGEDTPGYGPSYGGVGIYRSLDGGSTWANVASAMQVGGRCNRLVVDPTNSAALYLAGDQGVVRSTDAGATWTNVLAGHATDLVMAHDNASVMYAGLWNDGIYKTLNGGLTWTRLVGPVVISLFLPWLTDVSLPLPTGNGAGWIKLALGRSGPSGSNFVVAKMGKDSGSSYVSGDGGANWRVGGGSESVVYDEWTSFVVVHPANANVIFLGGLHLQRSLNGAAFALTSGTHSDHHQMVFDPGNTARCFVCCDGGVYRSDDTGGTWHLSSSYLQATQLLTLGVSEQGPFVAGSSTQDQGIIQTEGSAWWDNFNGGNEWGMFVVDPNDSSNIYVSPGDGFLRRSTDRGRNWSNPTNGLTDLWNCVPPTFTRPATFAHVAVQPGDSDVVLGVATILDQTKDADDVVTATYGPVNRVYLSTDRGNSWVNAFTLPSAPARVAYAPSDPNRAYAATSDGRFFRSDAAGQSGWYEPAAGSPVAMQSPAGVITSITVDRHHRNSIYLTYGNSNPHVYRTSDGGVTWIDVSGGVPGRTLPDTPINALVIDPENSDVLYVGSDIGVFRSNTAGDTWYPYNDGPDRYDLPRVIVTGLAMHPGTHRLFAATLGRGLYYSYTSGLRSLRVIAISTLDRGRQRAGITYLRLTDGSTTYTMPRAEVFNRIEAGTEVYVEADGRRVRVMAIPADSAHPMNFLQTETDYVSSDNLLSLPRFYA